MAYRYKLSSIDSCGTESPLGNNHKSIHLTINSGLNGAWNLLWNAYEGFYFYSYKIYRGTDSLNMNLLTQIVSTATSYTDLNPPTGLVYYQIEVINPNTCFPDSFYSKANTNYNSSRSNVANTMALLRINKIENNKLSVNIFPNPNDGRFIIKIYSKEHCKFAINIYNTLGKLVYSEKNLKVDTQNQINMNIGNLPKGLYFVVINDKKNYISKRVVIQ